MKVGIIGCGFIGTELAKFIDINKDFKLIGVNDINKVKVDDLIKKVKNNKPKFLTLEELILHSELIIESASKDVVDDILKNKFLDRNGKKLLVMSTSGLIENLYLLGKIKNYEILIPSGAIAGLDAIKAVSGKIKSLTLTTTKSPKSLQNAPYIIENKISLKNIRYEKIIFDGNFKDAINGFPQNINVAATLFLASKFKRIRVRIIAEPSAKLNIHEIVCAGDFGRIIARTENKPSANPRTSYLAVLSAIEILKGLKCNLVVRN